MQIPRTQVFDSATEQAYERLDGLLTNAARDMAFTGLNTGAVDPQAAKKVADRVARRAAETYQHLLAAGDAERTAKTLAKLLTELTVSSTAMWVAATHAAVNGATEARRGNDTGETSP